MKTRLIVILIALIANLVFATGIKAEDKITNSSTTTVQITTDKKLNLQDLSLEFLKKQSPSITRDYFLLQYLKNAKDLNSEQLLEIISLASRKNGALYQEILRRSKAFKDDENFKNKANFELLCQLKSDKELLNDPACAIGALNIKSTLNIDKTEVQKLIDEIEKLENEKGKNLAKKLNAIIAKDKKAALNKMNAFTFASFILDLPAKYRETYIDSISMQDLVRLSKENSSTFDRLIQYIILTQPTSFVLTKKRLLSKSFKSSNSSTQFFLGINAILLRKKSTAIYRMQESLSLAKPKIFANRASFWLYLLTGKKHYLESLANSSNIDIYTLYSLEILDKPPIFNITTTMDTKAKILEDFDISNPFEWQKITNDIRNIKDKSPTEQEGKLDELKAYFKSEETLPHLAYVQNIIDGYKSNYYLMPYADLVKFKNDDEKALTYAIAKQESNFLPTAISTSYALGLMQIMPFNIPDFAKATGNNIAITDIFKPEIAINLGKYYLDHLNNMFNHPLFVAYAYNGGPNFLKRILNTGNYFNRINRYEPWLSLELIPYNESRLYGKKVLANYIIYQRILGSKISIKDLLNSTMSAKEEITSTTKRSKNDK